MCMGTERCTGNNNTIIVSLVSKEQVVHIHVAGLNTNRAESSNYPLKFRVISFFEWFLHLSAYGAAAQK